MTDDFLSPPRYIIGSPVSVRKVIRDLDGNAADFWREARFVDYHTSGGIVVVYPDWSREVVAEKHVRPRALESAETDRKSAAPSVL